MGGAGGRGDLSYAAREARREGQVFIPQLTAKAMLSLFLTALCCLSAPASNLPQAGPEPGQLARPGELFDIVKVVDGDTIHIQRAGKLEKLRLLSVDTEERLHGSGTSATKPETVFGEECALWAQEFFGALASDGQPARIGLRFPDGYEERDVYGRLLCHVILPDGRDFNLLLVELGKSPYFNKYGNSQICHEAFVAAQARAMQAERGIWSPETNQPRDGEAPTAERPYARLLPWWQARADAIEAFRALAREQPERCVAADRADDLEAAAKRAGDELLVFGQLYKIYDEDDGSRTLLFRASDKQRALRVKLAKSELEAYAPLELDATLEEFRQNYLFVQGRLTKGERGFELRTEGPGAVRRAGPEPRGASSLPIPAGAGR